MSNTETVNVFKFDYRLFHTNLQGITHEESLMAPEKGGACINWIVGHIVLCRDEIHELIGIPGICGKKYYDLFGEGSDGRSVKNPIELDKMVELYDESQKTLIETLQNLDLSTDPKKLERLTFYSFHEAYHIGQIGILRRILGKESVIR